MSAIPRPDPPLRHGGLRLRPFGPADVPAVATACGDPSTRRFLPELPDPYTETDARIWVQSHEPARLEGRQLVSASAAVDDDRLLGALTAMVAPVPVRAELGYWLVPAARGHGHMTRAVRLLAGWLFEALALGRVELLTDPANLASRAVAQRCGFTLEAHLRAHTRDLASGGRRDSLVWGLLPGELC